jgi:hypothetical protein
MARTSEETKSAIIAALMTGQGVTVVAKKYKVDKATVSRIKSKISESDLQQLSTEKKEKIGDLIAKYLEESLHTLSVQQAHFRDKQWLKEQSAAELGPLHGIIADKVFRILEAVEDASEESNEES